LRRIKRSLAVFVATAFVVTGLSAWSASAAIQPIHTRASAQPVPSTMAAWQKDIANVRQPGRGCFHASYPALAWHAVKCAAAPKVPVPMAPAPASGSARHAGPATVGGKGGDYRFKVSGLITQATGSFVSVTSDSTESGLVANEGKPYRNAFTLQLNTQMFSGSPACSGASHPSDCQAWQQFVYAYGNRASTITTTTIYMQYWLINYDATCPSGWFPFSGDCYIDSTRAPVGTLTVSDLASVQLSGSASWDGNDAVSLMTGSGDATSVTSSDSMLDLAAYWNTTQWGVFGDGGGGEAKFSANTELEPLTALAGSIGSPSCTFGTSFTGESNNLNLGATPAVSELTPTMASVQTNATAGGPTNNCQPSAGATSAATYPDTAWDDEFQSYGDFSGAWSGGDGAQSLELPDGNTMWFFADTYLGQTDSDGTRPPLSSGIAHNSAVLYNASTGTLGPTSAASGSGGYNFLTDYSWVDPPPGYPSSRYELINGDQVMDNGIVYKFYQLADRGINPGGFAYKLVGTVMESFSVNGDTLTPEGGVPIGVKDTKASNPIIWGTAVLVSGGYIYIYGTKPYNATAPSATAYPLYLARVPVGELGASPGDWQYYDAAPSCNPPASAWGSSAPSQLMPGGTSPGFSVTDVNGTYVLLTNNTTGISNNAVAYYASCPTGFSAGSPHYLVYQPDVPNGYLTYEYRIVPQFSSLADGDVLVSYSQDSFLADASCMLENYYNATIYRPEFLNVQLPNLPNPGDSSGSVTNPPDPPTPPSFGTPPVYPDSFYTPTQDYPDTSTEMQDYCTFYATPSSSPTLTLTGNSNDVIDLSWSMQPTAMWMYSVVYCNVTTHGAGTEAGECPPDLVGPSGDGMPDSIPACSNSAAPNDQCGYNLYFGKTSSTVTNLDPGDVYEIQLATALAVLDGGYVGSNVLTVTATN
jgi:hypothetical protein